MRGLYGFLHAILAPPFKLIFNLKITGAENEPAVGEGAYLVCSNHMSAWDPIWLAAATRRQQPHFMAKAELFKIPLLRSLVRALGAYPVNRGGVDVSSIKNTIELLKSGKCVGIFPQGTRRRGVNPLHTPVKSGVGMLSVKAGVQVLPVFIATKKFKSSAFARKNIIVGRPIPAGKIAELYSERGEYGGVSRYIFAEICSLGGLFSPAGAAGGAGDS